MNRFALLAAAAALLAATTVSAQSAEVAPPKCEPKPTMPGRTLMKEAMVRKRFERDVAEYKACMEKYLDERKAAIKAHETAANAAINDYNATFKALNEAQKGD